MWVNFKCHGGSKLHADCQEVLVSIVRLICDHYQNASGRARLIGLMNCCPEIEIVHKYQFKSVKYLRVYFISESLSLRHQLSDRVGNDTFGD